MNSRLIRLIGVVFANDAMLSVSDKYDSVNDPSDQQINEIFKGCGKMPINLLGNWFIFYNISETLTIKVCHR